MTNISKTSLLLSSTTTFLYNKRSSLVKLQKWKQDFDKISPEQSELLSIDLTSRYDTLLECIQNNYRFLVSIAQPYKDLFEFKNNTIIGLTPTVFNEDKLISTLRQFVREWSEEGAEERSQSYTPLISLFLKYFPDPSLIKVLIPGVGQGRLLYEFCKTGADCQGNEVTYFMLFSSNFILNSGLKKNELTIYPFIHAQTNRLSFRDTVRLVNIPDESLTDNLPENPKMSMIAGEFVDTYSKLPG